MLPSRSRCNAGGTQASVGRFSFSRLKETAMFEGVDASRAKWRVTLLAALAGAAALGMASGAQAHDEGRWKNRWHHHHYYAPRYFYAPPRAVYVPPVVYPPPIAYAPAYPGYSSPGYYGPPGGSMSFGLTVPLP
jgi:hypothetical protein